MNILVVSSGIITDGDIDGNCMRKKKMIEGLQRNNYEVSILMYAPFGTKKERESNILESFKSYIFPVNLRVLSLASLSKMFRVQFYPIACSYFKPFSMYQERIKRIIEQGKINLIQCENIETAPWIQRSIKGMPVVITVHDVLVDRYREFFAYRQIPGIIAKPILKWVEKMEIDAIMNASQTVCCSKDDEARFLELGIPPEKLTTITSGATEIERFRPMPPDKNLQIKLGLTGKEPVLFFGGADSIQNVKAAENIAKHILPPVIGEFPDIKMLFTGTLSKVISSQRLEEQFPGRIINAGFVNDLELYYSLVKIVILPITVGSGIRLKVAEAMAAGKPIISTQKGIMGYDLKNNEHLIIENDLSLFPKHIKRLLKNRILRETLEYNARKYMLSFDWKHMMDGYQNIYQQVLNQEKMADKYFS